MDPTLSWIVSTQTWAALTMMMMSSGEIQLEDVHGHAEL
jgi:hypothetical protein